MGMGVPPLLRVAVKVTDWLTAGVVFDAVRVSWVAPTLIGTPLLADALYELSPAKEASSVAPRGWSISLRR